MKILVIGDIHGRLIWHDIIMSEKFDEVVFLGDYVSTHDNISSEQQIANLYDILEMKDQLGDKMILLRGNHDLQHLGYSWAECSGFDRDVYIGMSRIKDRFLANTQWIYIKDNLLFSHAGVSKVWLKANDLTVDKINDLEPSEIFGFTPGPNIWDFYGDSSTQPPTWIRPEALSYSAVEGYTQIVGHTPIKNSIFNIKNERPCSENIWLCDALGLGQYITIEDDNVEIHRFDS